MLESGPLLITSEAVISDAFLPSLCTPRGQVISKELNPHEDKALQKETLIHWLDNNGYFSKGSQLLNCGTNFAHLKDKNDHHKYGRMYCDNEFCPTCGTKGSRTHKTRTARAKDRLMWAPVLGAMVFTLPDEVSQSRPSRDLLKQLQKKIYDIILRNFNTPGGMLRIHLAGNHLGKLHIHFNVLFPLLNSNGIGKVDPQKLTDIRKDWTDTVNSVLKMTCEDTDVHYSFGATGQKKGHKIKYVLRPVVDSFVFMTLNDTDRHYILSLQGWHNTRWFGQLGNSVYKKYLTEKGVDFMAHRKKDPYLSKECPCCGEKYHFVEIVSERDLPMNQLRRIDNDTLVDLETYATMKAAGKFG